MKLWGFSINDYEYTPLSKYKQKFMYTYYHGKCIMFEIYEDIPVKKYITFQTPIDEDMYLYFLQPGEEIFLTAHTFYIPPHFIELTGSKLVKLT